MKELKNNLFLYLLALEGDGKLKKHLKNNRITQEEFIKCSDLIEDNDQEALENRIDILVEEIAALKKENEKLDEEKRQKAEENTQKINEVKQVSKNKALQTKEGFKNNQKKIKKIVIVLVILLIIMISLGAITKYVFKNYIGFTDVDLSSMIIIDYSQDDYSTTPVFDWTGNYYNENGYYDDFKSGLKESGIYTDEEIEQLIPTYDADIYIGLRNSFLGYDKSTEEELVNGETIEISINYDEEIARDEKINIINNTKQFEIKGLKEQPTIDDIKPDIFDEFGGIDGLQDTVLDDFITSYTKDRYTYTVEAVNFWFKDRSDEYEEGYFDNESIKDQRLYSAYLVKEVDNDGDRDPNYDLCYDKFDIYKQNDEMNIEKDNTYGPICSSTEISTLNEAIDEYMNDQNVDDSKYTKVEGMI